MKLFRGDNIHNLTEPGRYRFDGIMSKSFGKGKPAYIEAQGLLNNIRAHINPASASDRLVYDKTEFISFSSSENRALYWLSSKNADKITICQKDYQETRYLFILEFGGDELLPIDKSNTMFLFHFSCNPALKTFNTDSILTQALFSVVHPNTHYKSCPVCMGVHKNHSIVIINTVKYLETYKNSTAFDQAISNAKADAEWVILPVDSVSGFSGTTIPRADFWSARLYSAENEVRPAGIHEILGMAY